MQTIGTKDLGSIIESDDFVPKIFDNHFDCEQEFLNIVALVQGCKVAITQAERQSLLASRLSKDVYVIKKPQLQLLQRKNHNLGQTQWNHTDSLHDALMTVMAERDGAQSQLMAERVFHTHELDQERRKIEVLEKKIEVLKKLNNEDSASAAAFFLGTEEVPNKNSLGKIEKAMVQNVDAELMELCRQLSSEIATRVSTELEILRLKESRRIELETEKKQRQVLGEELNRYKEKMEEALLERDHFKAEAEKWKKSFTNAIAQNDGFQQTTTSNKSP